MWRDGRDTKEPQIEGEGETPNGETNVRRGDSNPRPPIKLNYHIELLDLDSKLKAPPMDFFEQTHKKVTCAYTVLKNMDKLKKLFKIWIIS